MSRLKGQWRVIGFLLGVLVLPWAFPLMGIVALNALGASIDVSEPRAALESPNSAGDQVDAGRDRSDASRKPGAALVAPERGRAVATAPSSALSRSHR